MLCVGIDWRRLGVGNSLRLVWLGLPSDERVNSCDENEVRVAESAGAEASGDAQTQAGDFRCKGHPDVRSPVGFGRG